ncbi:MAG: exonuclease SbcCD subunit D [bacterium]
MKTPNADSKNNAIIRFIHTSDWQLGMTRAFLSEEAGARFAQDRIDAIAVIGALASQHDAQFIVVAGDVFESNQLSRQTVKRTLDALRHLPVPIFLLPGNHDPLDNSSIFLTQEFQQAGSNIVVLSDTQPHSLPDCPGVEIIGAPWHTKHPSLDLCRHLIDRLEPTTATRIVVAHGQVDTLSPDKSRPEIIHLASVEQAIAEHKLHYLALGDRHSVTAVGTSERIWYSGAPVSTDFDEVAPNQVLLVSLEAERHYTVENLAVGEWQFIAHHQPINGAEDLDQLARWLEQIANKQRTAVKISFEGSIDLTTAAALDNIMREAELLFASLNIRERLTNLHVSASVADEDDVALSGYARSAWQELQQAAASGESAAEDALRLLFRLHQNHTG